MASTNGQPDAARKEKDAAGLDGRLLRRILGYLRPYAGWVAVAFVLVVVVAFLGPLQPRLVQIAIDDHVVVGDYPGLLRIIGILALVLVGQGVLSFVTGYLTQWIGQGALLDLRTRVFRHLQRQPLSYFDRQPVGRLITRATSDIEAMSDLLSAGIVTMLGDLFRIVFIAYFMFSMNAELAVVAMAMMPVMFWATMKFREKVRDAFRDTRTQVARLNAFLQEHVTGMQVVQIFNREREELHRFEEINDAHRKAQVRAIFHFALFWPAVDLIASVALGLVIWYGGLQAMGGALTVGVLIAFIQLVRQFFEPIRNLSDQYNTLQSAMAASERVFDVLDRDDAFAEPAEPAALEACLGRIEFRNVWFAYGTLAETGEPDWVLRDVSFVVEPGQTVALVGATGSGKSTIISLLLRFYEAQRGDVLVDGVRIQDYRLADLRRHIGLVLQDVFLFSGTLLDNITLGDPGRRREDVERAVSLVGADRFIDLLPGGLDYRIGERGVTLSYGQRQLVSFIRALVYDPEILVLDEATSSVDTETEAMVQRALDALMEDRTSLVVAHRLSTIQHAAQILVLDEATSSVDTETEAMVQRALDALMEDRTSLVVAHRLSTIQHAAQILVLHKGVIRERGTHQALLAEGGLYRRLYELQYADQERRAA